MKNLIYAPQPDDSVNELRLITRSLMLLALLSGILYIRVFIISTLTELDAGGKDGIGLLSFLFLVVAITGLLLTWRWERLGGLVVVGSGIGLALVTYFMSTDSPWLTSFFYGSPFVITGSLCLVSWHRTRMKNIADTSV
jgi:hypothetical protein